MAEVAAYLDSLPPTGPDTGEPDDPGTGDPAIGERGGVDDGMAGWVTRLVADFELWERIPACWAQHPAMTAELRVCQLLERFIAADGVDDPVAATPRRAEWIEYLGRCLDRLALTPGHHCAGRGEHRPARSWDRHATALARQQHRQHPPTPPGAGPNLDGE